MNDIMLEIKKKIIFNKWIKGISNGYGNAGLTLESLLGKDIENFELPDYKGIELKTKYSDRETYITLFVATPDSYLFEIKRILENYGYPDKNFPQFKVFNTSIYGNRRIKLNNYYFRLFVDYKKKLVILKIYDSNHKLIDDLCAWSFDLLKEKLERKFQYLAFIKANRKYELGNVYFKYNNIKFYKLSSFERFLRLIDVGFIRVTFRIGFYKNEKKYGKVYDHGTIFCIDERDLERLFDEITIRDQGE